MPSGKWRGVWGRRAIDATDPTSLQDLIELDGFDTGAGRVTAVDWKQYAQQVADELGLADGDSVFEVGCGSGAFLLALSRCKNISVAGLDYSQPLIDVARRAVPFGDFFVADALDLRVGDAYDFVVANGVFHYFTIDEAEIVLTKMLAKASSGVAVLDVPNLETRDESERVRAGSLPADEYRRKYAGLAHTYFAPDWPASVAAKSGSFVARTTAQFLPNYAQAGFRFNAFISRA